MPTTLFSYYQSKGQALPSLAQRAQLYQSFGLGSSRDYISKNKKGDPSANNSLLVKLQSGSGMSSSAPFTAPYPKTTGVTTPTTVADQATIPKAAETSKSQYTGASLLQSATGKTDWNQLGDNQKQGVLDQAKQFGVDPSTIPGYSAGTPVAPVIPTTPDSSTTSTWKNDAVQILISSGVDPSLANMMSDNQLALTAAQIEIGRKSGSAGTAVTNLDEATKLALNDKSINAKYGDSLAFGIDEAKNSLALLTRQVQGIPELGIPGLSAQQAEQFKKEQTALADEAAKAGRTYSGFRNKATQELAQKESGIVESTRAELQKNLRDLGTTFEQKYGTASLRSNLPGIINPTIPYKSPIPGQNLSSIGYTPVGATTPVTGSDVLGKSAEQASATQSNFQNLQPNK